MLQYLSECYSTCRNATVPVAMLQYLSQCYSTCRNATVPVAMLQNLSQCYSTCRNVTVPIAMLQYLSECYSTCRNATVPVGMLQYLSQCHSTCRSATLIAPSQSAKQSLPCILYGTNFHYHLHKITDLVCIYSWINPFLVLLFFFLHPSFNIIHV
jgi:hypothetical protein